MQSTCSMRTSVYKDRIVSLLREQHLLTIAQIHQAIPEADYSTIFRNVEQLLKLKKLRKLVIDGKSPAYELADSRHDHFICNDCGQVEEVTIALPSLHGRTVDEVTVRGTCKTCDA